MSVVVYSTPTCGYCHQAKAYLKQRGIPFTEHDVSRDQAAARQMIQLSGQQGVPVIVIDGQVVVGFNRPQIDQLLAAHSARPARLGAAIADAQQYGAGKGLSLPAGAFVGKVEAGQAGANAGLRAGDVIVQMAGQPIRTGTDVDQIVSAFQPGQSTRVQVWRNGSGIELTLTF